MPPFSSKLFRPNQEQQQSGMWNERGSSNEYGIDQVGDRYDPNWKVSGVFIVRMVTCSLAEP